MLRPGDHVQFLVGDLHDVSGMQLTSSASFGLPVHEHRLGRQKGLHIAPAPNGAGQFQELTEADRLPAYRDPLRHGPERTGEASRHCATSGRVRRLRGRTSPTEKDFS